jgi:hypothetical protein
VAVLVLELDKEVEEKRYMTSESALKEQELHGESGIRIRL